MAFEHSDKKAGDLIRSADWNAMGTEVVRLGIDKISRAGTESLDGPLTVRGDLSVGAGSSRGSLTVLGGLTVGAEGAGSTLRIYKKQETGKGADDGALVLGKDTDSSAALRLGYSSTYSWLQGQGQQDIAINPNGGSVGIGAVPTGATRLQVGGDAAVTGALGFGATTRQMLNLWNAQYGIGVQNSTTYLRTEGSFAFYRGGGHADAQLDPGGGTTLMTVLNTGRVGVATKDAGSSLSVNGNASIGSTYAAKGAPANGMIVEGNVGIGSDDPKARLHVAGGDIRLDSGRELFIADNGQIRSLDNNHRILFRRSEDKLELREYGSIVFSSGATEGKETAKAVLAADGTLTAGAFRFGNSSLLQGDQGGSIELGGNNSTAGTGTPYIDFHYQGKTEDYNARIINNGDRVLTVDTGRFQVLGRLQSPSGRQVRTANDRVDLKSSAWNDLKDMNMTISTTGNMVLVMCKIGGVQISETGEANAQFQLLVGGVQRAYTLHEFRFGGWELRDVTLVWLGSLDAGNHAVKVQWLNSKGKVTACWYNDTRTLIAVEL